MQQFIYFQKLLYIYALYEKGAVPFSICSAYLLVLKFIKKIRRKQEKACLDPRKKWDVCMFNSIERV